MAERFVPGIDSNEMAAMHNARYQFAGAFVGGKRALDFACGSGYGSTILKEAGAMHVTGMDRSKEAIVYANSHFKAEGVEFVEGRVEDISSLKDVEVVVSFETIEHLEDAGSFLKVVNTLLGPDGLFVVSTPLRLTGTIVDKPVNPFHVREWSESEFQAELSNYFVVKKVLHQYVYWKPRMPFSRTAFRLAARVWNVDATKKFEQFEVLDRAPVLRGARIIPGFIVALCGTR